MSTEQSTQSTESTTTETTSTTQAPNPFLSAIQGLVPQAQAQETPAAAAPPEPAKAAEPEKPAAPPEPPAAQRFAAAAKLERELRQKERALKEAQEKLTAREAELSPWQKARETAAKNPAAALEALGITYEQLTDAILAGGVDKPVDVRELAAQAAREAAAAERKSWEEKLAQERAQEQTRQYEAFVQSQRARLAAMAQSEGDKYELSHVTGAAHGAWQLVEEAFAEDSTRVLEPGEALGRVEQRIESEFVDLLKRSPKLRQLVQRELASLSPTPAPQQGAKPPHPAAPTLTNRGAAEVAAVQREAPMTDYERIQAAARLLKFG